MPYKLQTPFYKLDAKNIHTQCHLHNTVFFCNCFELQFGPAGDVKISRTSEGNLMVEGNLAVSGSFKVGGKDLDQHIREIVEQILKSKKS